MSAGVEALVGWRIRAAFSRVVHAAFTSALLGCASDQECLPIAQHEAAGPMKSAAIATPILSTASLNGHDQSRADKPNAILGAVLFEVMDGPFAAGIGDANGDGLPDIAVSSRKLHNDVRPNAVRIYAGGAGRVLLTIQGGTGFGYRVEMAGDVDRDGTPDVIVTTGDRSERPESVVEVYSGRTGAALYAINGGEVGAGLATVGDVNGDSYPDHCLTIDRDPEYGVGCYSGVDGKELWATMRPGVQGAYHAGFSGVAAVGDTNADGILDLAFAGPSPPGDVSARGQLYVLSGADGSELRTLNDGVGAGEAHEAVSAIGDVDADGCADILAQAWSGNRSCVMVFSGRDGTALLQVTAPTTNYGWAVAGVGDVDGDNVPDFAVGAPPFDDNQEPGKVFMYSGRNGALLVTLEGPPADTSNIMHCFFPPSFGVCVKGIGDFNGDGFADVLVGEAREIGHGSAEPDRIVIYFGGPAGSSHG